METNKNAGRENSPKAKAKRRALHGMNLKQISKSYCFCLFALGSSHVKFNVWPLAKEQSLLGDHFS